MNTSVLSVDVREFQRAMVEYVAASKLTFADALNKIARDLLYRAAQFTPRGSIAKINDLPTRTPMWWKFIASQFKDRPKVTGHVWRDSGGRKRHYARHYTRHMAQKASSAIIGSRRSHVSFLRSGFAKAGHKLGQNISGKAAAQNTTADVKRASRHSLAVMFDILWPAIADHGGMAREGIVRRAMQDAIAFKTRDMQVYLDRKNAELCRQVSAFLR